MQLTSKDALIIIRLKVLKVSFSDCMKASNFRSEKPMGVRLKRLDGRGLTDKCSIRRFTEYTEADVVAV